MKIKYMLNWSKPTECKTCNVTIIRKEIHKWMKEINKDNTDSNALVEAAKHGKLDFVMFLTNHNTNIYMYKSYALQLASESGHFEIVKFLVNKGADIHIKDDYAFRWASRNGHFKIVKFLVNNGANIYAQDNYALRWASYNGHFDVTEFLEYQMNKDKEIDKEIIKKSLCEKCSQDLDSISDMGIEMRAKISKWMKEIGEEDTDENALIEAAYYGKLDFVKFLVSQGADIHIHDDYAFRWASINGHFDIVKFLVSNGADIHAKDNEALRWAGFYGHTNIVEFLESQINKNKGIVKKFLCKKCSQDLDSISDMGIGMRTKISTWMKEIRQEDTDDNALAEAARYGKLDFVKFLVSNGADIHVYNDFALQWASANGHIEVVKFLVSYGADIHANYNSALQLASKNGHFEVVKFLVDQVYK